MDRLCCSQIRNKTTGSLLLFAVLRGGGGYAPAGGPAQFRPIRRMAEAAPHMTGGSGSEGRSRLGSTGTVRPKPGGSGLPEPSTLERLLRSSDAQHGWGGRCGGADCLPKSRQVTSRRIVRRVQRIKPDAGTGAMLFALERGVVGTVEDEANAP